MTWSNSNPLRDDREHMLLSSLHQASHLLNNDYYGPDITTQMAFTNHYNQNTNEQTS